MTNILPSARTGIRFVIIYCFRQTPTISHLISALDFVHCPFFLYCRKLNDLIACFVVVFSPIWHCERVSVFQLFYLFIFKLSLQLVAWMGPP